MLGYHYQVHNHNAKPCLVWLHGLLGSTADWQDVVSMLADYSHLLIDLPGHGSSKSFKVSGFNELDQQVNQLLKSLQIERYILIGYSLGGRIAMYHACHSKAEGLCGIAVEGGNLGLRQEYERVQRIGHDHQWAERFRNEPLKQVLSDWYQQPIFDELNTVERVLLVNDRKSNSGQAIADILESTSLGQQPWLADKLCSYVDEDQLPFCYLCGELDTKFQQIAKEHHLPLRTVAKAGHNAHRANPQGFAQQLISFLKEC